MSFLKMLLIIIVFVFGWRVAESISPDAIALTSGVLIGAILVIPGVLIALWVYNNERNRSNTLTGLLYEREQKQKSRFEQPQILIVGGGHGQYPQLQAPAQQQLALPDLKQKPKRQIIVEGGDDVVDGKFRVVGDEDSKW